MNQFVILSFGVDPLNWPSFIEIGEIACVAHLPGAPMDSPSRLKLSFMSTNLEYRARERQRKRGARPAKLNDKKGDRNLERETKNTKETVFCWKTKNIFSTVILASHSLLQFVAFWCRSAFIVASDWFVLPI